MFASVGHLVGHILHWIMHFIWYCIGQHFTSLPMSQMTQAGSSDSEFGGSDGESSSDNEEVRGGDGCPDNA